MAHHKKVWAQIFACSRHGCTGAGLKVTVEFLLLYGPGTRCGKVETTVGAILDPASFRRELVAALVADLRVRFAPDIFTARDIIGVFP